VGCNLALSNDPGILQCHFSNKGFKLAKTWTHMQPCRLAYHVTCIAVGDPFVTQRKNNASLSFPNVTDWGTFVCKACTVRAVVGSKLTDANDWQLLALERMHLIDMVHHDWSLGTHGTYQTKLHIIRNFEQHYGVHVLCSTPLRCPPSGTNIPLVWCQEAYALRKFLTKRHSGSDMNLAFSTIRQLCSAASQFLAWDMMISQPDRAFMDHQHCVLEQPCRPTDGLSYTLYTGGLRAHVGDQTDPLVALIDCHVCALDQELNLSYLQCRTPHEKCAYALVGLANLVLWLGWLRSSKTFDLEWRDLLVVEPDDSATMDLPAGCGMVSCRLAAETKSARSHWPDVLWPKRHSLATIWGNGFTKLGMLLACMPTVVNPQSASSLTPTVLLGLLATSTRSFFIPLSIININVLQVTLTSALLMALQSTLLKQSCGPYTVTDVVLIRMFQEVVNSAVIDEVYEHGRWRRQHSGEAIDKI
jgi:hypothetical protein